MKIFVSKQRNNIFSFFYLSDTNHDYFCHNLSIPMGHNVKDNDLFRVLINSSPFDFSLDNQLFISGLSVSNILKSYFENSYKIKIECDILEEDELIGRETIQPSDTILLGFSGGFDSLAAKKILPDNTKCISIEFGGAFQRESDFFNKLDTTIIKWDLRNYRESSFPKFKESANWRFMVAPITLYRKNQNVIISTGTILEASPFWFSSAKRQEFKYYSDFGLGKGVSLINPLAGITEYATTKIVLNSFEQSFIMDSLKSLAPLDSFKYHRKLCLISAVKNDFSEIPIPKQKHKLGSGFADDLFTLYFCWKNGIEWTKKYYAENIPDKIVIHNLSFVEKLNERNLNLLDIIFKNNIIKKINNYGIQSYSQDDYTSLEYVRKQLISKNYIV